MPMHQPQAPTLDSLGQEVHPAFGLISVHRVTSTPGDILFDSDVRHSRVIRLRIHRARRSRDLSHDHVSEAQSLIEVDMSEAQFASCVSSMNTMGVPCTLRRVGDDYNVPGLEYAPRLKQTMDEVHEAASAAFAQIEQAMAELDGLDAKAGVKARREAMDTLRSRIRNAVPNVDWAGQQLAEQAEAVVQRARADVEAMVTAKAAQLGIEPSEIASPLIIESGDAQ